MNLNCKLGPGSTQSLQLPHVNGHAAAIFSIEHLNFVFFFFTQEQYRETIIPSRTNLILSSESTQFVEGELVIVVTINVGGSVVGVFVGGLVVGAFDGDSDNTLGAADGSGEQLSQDTGHAFATPSS